mmetsp:Transcript_60293/g.159390  ORF Transcript_60293/g.159390 Transcript_60293/m.159390 type:complete len:217 (-) Transcript_60293:176-826(-)
MSSSASSSSASASSTSASSSAPASSEPASAASSTGSPSKKPSTWSCSCPTAWSASALTADSPALSSCSSSPASVSARKLVDASCSCFIAPLTTGISMPAPLSVLKMVMPKRKAGPYCFTQSLVSSTSKPSPTAVIVTGQTKMMSTLFLSQCAGLNHSAARCIAAPSGGCTGTTSIQRGQSCSPSSTLATMRETPPTDLAIEVSEILISSIFEMILR